MKWTKVSHSVMPSSLWPPWPGSSVHGIIQARILEWVDIPFSRVSSWSRDWTWVFCIGKRILYHLSHQGSPTGLLWGIDKLMYVKNLEQWLIHGKNSIHVCLNKISKFWDQGSLWKSWRCLIPEGQGWKDLEVHCTPPDSNPIRKWM